MKKLIIIFILSSFSLIGYSQTYSNNWIDYSQKYYRIPITNEGVYRITYANLVTYGISVGDFDPRNIQIIHNGETLPVFVSGESDWIFNNTDYFEFYAPGGNTGIIDTAVYVNSKPLNPGYSLYNDTASYFLTFANTLESPRYDTARNTNYGAYTPLSYCLKTVRQNFTSLYNENIESHSPYILDGEGWSDNYFNMGASTTKILSTPRYNGNIVGKPYTLKFGLSGYLTPRHDLFVECPTGNPVFDTIYTNYSAIHKSLNLTNSLSSTTSITFKSIAGYNKLADKNCVTYVEITYPHDYNFEGNNFFSFTLPKVTSGGFILLDIVNFDGGDAPILYCPQIGKRLVAKKTGIKYQVLVPNYYEETQCILVSASALQSVPKIMNVKTKNTVTSSPSMFYDLSAIANQGNYIIITHSSLWTYANSYKSYRTSTGHQVILIDINEIYNQFGYGIQKHPYAIHEFIRYAVNEWNINPENIFLIGKGYHLKSFRNNPTLYANTLIPTMCTSSDLLFTTDVHAISMVSNIAIGRLAARTNTDVENYRRKVVEHETQTPAPWMKTVLHFGGGTTEYEKLTIKRNLEDYEVSLEGEYFGADVHTFLKESSDVFEKTEPEAIRELMNNGTSLLNFFGHASGNSFDQSIDHPSLFSNQGKYPLMIANSCYSGDLFAEGTDGINETWTLIPNRGSIGFIGNLDLGNLTYLHTFTLRFINNIARNNYGNSIGSNIEFTLLQLQNQYGSVQSVKNSSLSFTYHGDPAIKIHSFTNSDLEIKESSVFFNPSLVTNDLEAFTTNIIVFNNGRATLDTCNLHITYTSESGSIFTIDTLIHGFFFKDTFAIVLPVKYFESGNYKINILIDSENRITELSETNNEITIDFFISSRDILPVYPPKYAIIPTNTVNLKISAVDPMNPPTSIIIEIDTSATFTSTQKISQTIQTNNNATISWNPGITLLQNQVYFWHVTDADSIKWNESSFVYEEDKNGWVQKHPHQFIENSLSYITYSENDNLYSFITNPHELYCNTKGVETMVDDNTNCLYMLDGVQMATSGFPLYLAALHVVILDSTTVDPWLSNRDYYGQRNYPTANGTVRKNLMFTSSDATARNNLAIFLRDSVPVGNYIMIYTFKFGNFQLWEENLYTAFEELGATLPRTIPNNYPYIFYCKKGDVSTAQEVVGATSTSLITFRTDIPSNYFQGTQTSTTIGPSNHYQELVWESQKLTDEESNISILGNTTTNSETYEVETNILVNHDRLDTLVRTDIYPSIILDNYIEDIPHRTPPHLKLWKVYFDPIGELAVSPEYLFSLHYDTVKQGENIVLQVSAQNISNTQMDSVLVLFEIRNNLNELIISEYHRISPANAQTYITDILTYNTQNLSGSYTIKIEFNPINPETGMYDQLESHHFNNTLFATFFVVTDKTKPVLDVLTDGRHLMNNDYISTNPKIIITLFDENDYLFLQDTSLFTITITNLATGVTTPYYFNGNDLIFIPADNSSKICKVIFTPEFLENGEYVLNVQAKDASNNDAGLQSYSIKFQIDTEQKISVLFNFPNPCINYTTFRFILTGSTIPENMKIQIFSTEGKIIQEIPISNIYIGTNSFDAFWDGRDFDGQMLANGIYTYRLLYSNKSAFGHLETKHDEFMSSKYGRLIIRK